MAERGKRIGSDLVDEIHRLEGDGRSAAEILRKLELDERFAGRAPTLRTVSKYVADARQARGAEQWPGTRPSQDAWDNAAALDVLPYVIQHTKGRVTELSNREVQWIAHLRAVRPDLPVNEVWALTRFYLARIEGGFPTTSLDTYLAYAPWRRGKYSDLYFDAIEKGWIDPAPFSPAGLDHSESAGITSDVEVAAELWMNDIVATLVPVLASWSANVNSSMRAVTSGLIGLGNAVQPNVLESEPQSSGSVPNDR